MEAEELARVPKFKARPLDKRVRVSSQWYYESIFYFTLAWFLAIASDFSVSPDIQEQGWPRIIPES